MLVLPVILQIELGKNLWLSLLLEGKKRSIVGTFEPKFSESSFSTPRLTGLGYTVLR